KHYTYRVVLPLPSETPRGSTSPPSSFMIPMLPLSNRSKQGRNRYLPKHSCSGGLLGNVRSSGIMPTWSGVTIHTTMQSITLIKGKRNDKNINKRTSHTSRFNPLAMPPAIPPNSRWGPRRKRMRRIELKTASMGLTLRESFDRDKHEFGCLLYVLDRRVCDAPWHSAWRLERIAM